MWIFVLKQKKEITAADFVYSCKSIYIIDIYYEHPYIWLHIKSMIFSPQKQNLLKNKSKETVEKISAALTQIG